VLGENSPDSSSVCNVTPAARARVCQRVLGRARLAHLQSLSTCCSTCLVLIDVHVLVLIAESSVVGMGLKRHSATDEQGTVRNALHLPSQTNKLTSSLQRPSERARRALPARRLDRTKSSRSIEHNHALERTESVFSWSQSTRQGRDSRDEQKHREIMGSRRRLVNRGEMRR